MKKTTRICFYSAVLMLLSISGLAQTTWEKLFSKKSTDAFRAVIEVPAGGYMIAGYTSDSTINDTDAYAVRMTTSGDTLWTRRINGTASRKDLFYKVINTSDGGFAFCGYSTNNGIGNDDAYWVKMDANGTIQWSKYWGGTVKERAQDIVQTADNGYAIVGYTNSPPAAYYDAFLIRTNSSGDTLWTKHYGSGAFEDANSVLLLPDGGFIFGGQSTNGANGLDMYMVRVSANGDMIWTKKFGTAFTDNIENMIRESDGSYILAGGTEDTLGFGGNDGYLVKTDTGGTVIWSKKYGGNSQDDFHQVFKTGGGNYILSGTSRSSGALDPNLWMVKTNSSGDSLWTQTYGGDNNDHGYDAIQTADGGYIMVGYTSSFGFNGEEAYVVKSNNLGDVGNYLTYATVSALIQPLQGNCVATNVQVKVVVRNFGRDTVPNVPVTIQISGPITQTINQTYNGSIYPGDLDTLAFSTLLDMSTPGQYTFSCTSSNVNDVFPKNNNLLSTVTIVNYAALPSPTDGIRCGTGSVMLSASSPDSVFWYSALTGGSLLGSGLTYNTPVISSTTTYYAQAGASCPSSRVPVVANIYSVPAAPTPTSAQRCGTGSVQLSATATDPVRWFTAASGGTQVGTGNTFNTPSLSTTTTYYAEAYNPACASTRMAATATINPISSNPVPTPAFRCNPGTVTLTATASDPITWYDASVGGNIVGTGTSFTTPSLTSTTTYYVEASNGICPSNRMAIQATISSQVADPIVSPNSRCGSGTVTLGATSNETLIWYASASGGTQLGVGSSFVTPFISTTTTYYVLATNGACPSNYIAVQATIHPAISINLGPDTAIGFGLTYLLDPGAGFSQYSWTGGDTTQTLTVSITGNYCVTVTNGNGCTATDCAFVQISVGIDAPKLESNFSFYPNPVNDVIYLEMNQDITELTCQFYAIDGRMIFENGLHDLSAGIPVAVCTTSLASGIYLMKLFTKEWTNTLRIIRK